MALQINTISPQGFVAKNAYVRVQGVSILNKTQMDVAIQFLKDETATVSFKNQNWSCEYSINGANPIAQAYEYLKTLPEFADAVDC